MIQIRYSEGTNPKHDLRNSKPSE